MEKGHGVVPRDMATLPTAQCMLHGSRTHRCTSAQDTLHCFMLDCARRYVFTATSLQRHLSRCYVGVYDMRSTMPLTRIVFKSCQNGVGHNIERFARDILLLFSFAQS